MFAGNWNWIIAANILLGINQGLTWSSTVIMKIDLVGEKDRGFAMGLNEFSGYIAVALVAFLTSWIASEYGLRPYPFYVGIALIFGGLLTSILFVRDTKGHVVSEAIESKTERLGNVFWKTTAIDKNLSSVTQAGLINNLNDGMVWGLLPVYLAQQNFSIKEIGIIVAIYPAVWGLGQLFTGKLSDIVCKKSMLFWGMMLQGVALMMLLLASSFIHYVILLSVLGWGTAMVYPTFLASIAESTHPLDRAKSLGTFRLWRDLSYAVGAILTGVTSDLLGLSAPIIIIGALTILSGLLIQWRMSCTTEAPKLLDWIFKRKIELKNADSTCKNNLDSCIQKNAFISQIQNRTFRLRVNGYFAGSAQS